MGVLLVTGLRSIGMMGVEVRELQLTFADDKAVVQLPMLNDEFATHLCVPPPPPRPCRLSMRLDTDPPNAHRRYISHYWRNAQEQCRVLKSLLLTMLPTCKIYLDDDDIEDDDEEIEGQLDQATAVLVFLTSEYVGSHKCMLELTTAWRMRKPLIVVREADSLHGGLSAKAFESEVEMYVARHLKGSDHVKLSDDEQSALGWLQSGASGGARATQSVNLPSTY